MSATITDSHLIEEESAVLSGLSDRMQERLAALEKLPQVPGVVRAHKSLSDAIGLVSDALVGLDMEWDK